ncbi:hypothetical protein KKC1_33950, partial [Calderihabitans maritimus]
MTATPHVVGLASDGAAPGGHVIAILEFALSATHCTTFKDPGCQGS